MGIFSRKEAPREDGEEVVQEEGYLDIARREGKERQERIGERLSSIREHVRNGVAIVLGTPEAVGAAAKDAGGALGQAAEKVGEGVVHGAEFVGEKISSAARKTWEGLGNMRDKLVEGTVRAKEGLVDRFERSKEATKTKVSDLKERGTEFVKTKIAAPLEDKVNKIYSIPDRVREAMLERKAEHAERDVAEQAKIREAELISRDAYVKALQEQIADRVAAAQEVIDKTREAEEAARESAQAYKEEASALRDKGPRFAKFSGEVDSLELSE
ncbi:MAG: hypothetical protein NUV96_01835 [Candidatus Colwellbacteria bacterium]|nr:hypothetical protein [Candidatus Colwellbacteria bacterium]